MPVPEARSDRLVPSSTDPLSCVAYGSFALYLIIMLGTNSVARTGGALTWLPLVRLPAGDGNWEVIGALALLPAVSAVAWLGARAKANSLRAIGWGWGRVARPLAVLAAAGLLNTIVYILSGDGSPATLLRLIILLVHLAWGYLYLVNEKPDLLWIIAAVIAIQSTVAIGQFVGQQELGLSILGELSLDPQVGGVSIAMRGSERWLRGYGLATNPNTLAGTLVTMLALLPALERNDSRPRREFRAVIFVLGFAALLTTLSRWAAACLGLALAVNLIPWLRDVLRHRRWSDPPLGAGTWLAVMMIGGLFVAIYGDAISGRFVGLQTPIESRSVSERGRDSAISLEIIAANPILGVGLGEYLDIARQNDPAAKVVHSVPLHLAAEIGLFGLVAWVWLVLAPLLRRGALTRHAAVTGLWLGFWLLGVLQPAPNPLYELRSALLTGLVAGVMAQSGIEQDGAAS